MPNKLGSSVPSWWLTGSALTPAPLLLDMSKEEEHPLPSTESWWLSQLNSKYQASSSVFACSRAHLLNWRVCVCVCVCGPGQQDGCWSSDGAAGGHTRHSCLCSQPVWEPGDQTAPYGVCASGKVFLPTLLSECPSSSSSSSSSPLIFFIDQRRDCSHVSRQIWRCDQAQRKVSIVIPNVKLFVLNTENWAVHDMRSSIQRLFLI